MTPGDDIRRDLAATSAPEELDELVRLGERLVQARPVPSAAFRGELRRRLLRGGPAGPRPARLRLLVAAYGGSGLALLLVAGAGLVGAGPFTT